MSFDNVKLTKKQKQLARELHDSLASVQNATQEDFARYILAALHATTDFAADGDLRMYLGDLYANILHFEDVAGIELEDVRDKALMHYNDEK